MADVIWQLVKPAVVADDEDVVVGNGVEGLVLHKLADRGLVLKFTSEDAAFIVPSAPVLKRNPPTGPEWLHEIKLGVEDARRQAEHRLADHGEAPG